MPMKYKQFVLPRLPGVVLAIADTSLHKNLTLIIDQNPFGEASNRGPRADTKFSALSHNPPEPGLVILNLSESSSYIRKMHSSEHSV